MAANTEPRYPLTPQVGWDTRTTANNVYNGTGTVGTIETFGIDGTFVGYIKLKPLGTNVASVARFFLNNGSTNATATNNALIAEVTLPATTASATAALTEITVPINLPVQAGYVLNWVLGTTVAAGWQATVFSVDY